MKDIFLSYAREDEDRIKPLIKALQDKNLSVFWDRRIPAGSTWRSYIGKELDEALCVIVVWSKHSIDSNWVSEEANVASSKNKLVPVLLDPVEAPLGFRSIQAADLSFWNERKSQNIPDQLFQDIYLVLNKNKKEPIPQSRPITVTGVGDEIKRELEKNKSRFGIALLALVVLMVLGIFIYTREQQKAESDITEATMENPKEPVKKDPITEPEKEGPIKQPDKEGETGPPVNPEKSPDAFVLEYFTGSWNNVDPNTRGVTKLKIRNANNLIYLQVWGKCHPNDCDWGEVKADVFGGNVSQTKSVNKIEAFYNPGFAKKTINIFPEQENQIRMEITTRFTDGSGRSNTSNIYYFKKNQIKKPMVVMEHLKVKKTQ